MPEQRVAEGLPEWIREHLTRYMESDGADGHLWDSSIGGGEGMIETLLLTTTGRKSGLGFTIPLIYGKTDGGYCVIASKGGAPTHPAWYLNLDADPEVHIQVGADKYNARARVAQGDERSQLWQQMVGIYGPYEDYKVAAGDRVIPVVVIEPT
ncbi:MAG: nitroreductase family deazaflavin-dependent oxidoreductase [Halieaceae bacterium]